MRFWIEYGLTPPGKRHWGVDYYDSPIHRGHMHWDDPEWVSEVDSTTGRKVHERIDYTNKWSQYLQANISGPLVLPGLSFFLSTEWLKSAAGGIGPAFYSNQPYSIPQSSLRITYNITPSIKLKMGSIYEGHESWNSGPSVGGIRGLGDKGRNTFLPMYTSSAGKSFYANYTNFFSLTHLLTPMLYYDLRVSWTGASQEARAIPDSTTEPRMDKDGWFYIGRDAVTYSESERNRFSVKFDLSYQAPKNHFIKTGIDFTRFKTWSTAIHEFPEYRRVLYMGKNHHVGKALNPQQWAFYIQDKMEFEGMVINAGIRVDHFESNVEIPITIAYASSDYMYNTFTRFDYEDMRDRELLTKAENQTVWAPRFGVAHPITERASLHFFYGHIYQLPSFYTLFGEQWDNRSGALDEDLNSDGIIGPTEMYNRLYAHGLIPFSATPISAMKKRLILSLELIGTFIRNTLSAAQLIIKAPAIKSLIRERFMFIGGILPNSFSISPLLNKRLMAFMKIFWVLNSVFASALAITLPLRSPIICSGPLKVKPVWAAASLYLIPALLQTAIFG